MQRISRSQSLHYGLVFLAISLVAPLCPGASKDRVVVRTQTDRVVVEIDGKLFTEYHFLNVPRPYFYPLLGPGGAPMTRNWPMKTVPDEEQDHVHHRSLWFTHGDVNGQDFWSESKEAGRIEHDRFVEVVSGPTSGRIVSRNRWVAKDGTLVCTDQRVFRVYAPDASDARTVDYEITLEALERPLVFGDTKEGSMAIRLAETMRLKGKVGAGHIVNSAGQRDGETWGKRAAWCDYYGPVNGKIVGVAMFDHPDNPRHPTWWHVRDYGLFAANPFGKHDFEKLTDKAAGNLTVEPGAKVTFKYRLYLHPGNELEGKVAEQFRRYLAPSAKP
jgi:hypothetical protein